MYSIWTNFSQKYILNYCTSQKHWIFQRNTFTPRKPSIIHNFCKLRNTISPFFFYLLFITFQILSRWNNSPDFSVCYISDNFVNIHIILRKIHAAKEKKCFVALVILIFLHLSFADIFVRRISFSWTFRWVLFCRKPFFAKSYCFGWILRR